jgi:hypothetical protein
MLCPNVCRIANKGFRNQILIKTQKAGYIWIWMEPNLLREFYAVLIYAVFLIKDSELIMDQ